MEIYFLSIIFKQTSWIKNDSLLTVERLIIFLTRFLMRKLKSDKI